MNIFDVNNFKGGWFIGNFSPSVFRTSDFEIAYKTHAKDEEWPTHYHAQAEEINYLISGNMSINNIELVAPIIFVIDKNEIAKPVFKTDVSLIVVKIPSVINDKFEV